MSKPTITSFVTPGGKKRFQLKWYYQKHLERKRFDTKAEALRWVAQQREDSDSVHQQIRDTTDAEQADIVTALTVAREHGFTLTEAANAYATRPTNIKKVTMQEAIDKFLKNRRTKGSREKTLKTYGDALAYFKATVGKDDPNTVRRSDIEEFLDNKEWKPTTRNYYFRHVRAFFNWLDGDHIAENPFAAGKIEETQTDEDRVPKIFTVEEATALMKAAKEHDKTVVAYLATGLFAGIRPVGIERMSWEDIDLKGGIITVPKKASKTRHEYDVHIEANLGKWLSLVRDQPFVPKNLRHRLEVVRDKAGVGWDEDIMRHSFGSYHLDCYKDPKSTAWELGHKGEPRMLFKHYRKLVKRGQGKRFFKIAP